MESAPLPSPLALSSTRCSSSSLSSPCIRPLCVGPMPHLTTSTELRRGATVFTLPTQTEAPLASQTMGVLVAFLFFAVVDGVVAVTALMTGVAVTTRFLLIVIVVAPPPLLGVDDAKGGGKTPLPPAATAALAAFPQKRRGRGIVFVVIVVTTMLMMMVLLLLLLLSA